MWPQVLAETGVVGLAAYAGLFITLITLFLLLSKQLTYGNMKGPCMGFAIFILIIVIWGFGGTFKHVIISSNCAFAGMTIGGMLNQNKDSL
jgi:hypothetical protein